MARFAKIEKSEGMTTMNVSLPDELKAFLDNEAARCGYVSTSEFVRHLIRREQDRQQLRSMPLDGAAFLAGPIADEGYFSALRGRLRTAD
jgi:antitoxin ParD1/3/4